jgi:hypothetical protein
MVENIMIISHKMKPAPFYLAEFDGSLYAIFDMDDWIYGNPNLTSITL